MTRLTILFASLSMLSSAEAHGAEVFSIKRACTRTEYATFTGSIPKSFQTEFNRFLSRSTSPTRAFSQALALRKLSQDDTSQAFAEYWISRSLFESGLTHLAFRAFRTMIAKPASSTTASIQAAALECLATMHEALPSLEFDPTLVRKIFELTPFIKESIRHRQAIQPGVWAGALSLAFSSGDFSGAEVQVLTKAVADMPRAEAFIRGFFAHARGNYTESIAALRTFIATTGAPARLDRHVERARILLAHALYATGKYDDAGRQLSLVPKNSPLLPEALSELAWAHLMAGRQKDAVGVAMSLGNRGLRKHFAPEGPMVLAIALNELCHYPEAIRATQLFKREYQPVQKWLKEHEKDAPYDLIVALLKKTGDKIPDRIASEWLRHPGFLTRQEEINLTLTEPGSADKQSDQGAREQTQLAANILKRAQAVRRATQLAKRDTGRIPAGATNDLQGLKDDIRLYRRYQLAAPVWRTILEGDARSSKTRTAALTDLINRDLKDMSTNMRKRLDEIAENNYFIEVEIYQGASQDLVWQESHPDYREIAETIRDAEGPKNHEVWKWGTASLARSGDEEEVWEDEQGSFYADLFNNCSSKERYLAIKQEQIVRRMKQ